ncbi:MAG: hypothetical protein AAF357_13280 [Verrucomicrobiota bacterium]
MINSVFRIAFGLCTVLPLSGEAQEKTEEGERSVIKITPQPAKPSAMSIVPIDESNVFFLNKRGQVGVAKFSPGLSLIEWEFFSEVKWNSLPAIASGPNYSVILASPWEVTQAFDTDEDVELDFFQRILSNWPGKERGAQITAGPVVSPAGRLLFALSIPEAIPAAEGETPAVEKALVVAWNPKTEDLITVTESTLPIESFAVDRHGLLAARLLMPEYQGGYFISLTKLPPFDASAPEMVPDSMPFTLPSLVVPAELTRNTAPTQLTFFNEDGSEKLAAVCPDSSQIIEIAPEEVAGVWGGSILLRQTVEDPVETLVEMKPGELLAGGENGFFPLSGLEEKFRITRLGLAPDGIEIDLSEEVDRFEAAKSENYLVQAVSLQGGETELEVTPTVESDGRTVVLKTENLPAETVIRIICHRLPSASGETLLSNAAFYTIHKKPVFDD